MNTSTEVMQTLVKNDLIRHFSSHDGWEIQAISPTDRYDQVYTMKRSNRGVIEKYLVGISFSPVFPDQLLQSLNTKSTEKTPGVRIIGKGVLIPVNTDSKTVPADFQIFRMRHFAYREKKLVWLKKPERQERVKENQKNT